MNNPELYNDANQATYCPEDNKLRLYVGRVPRDEYDALRAEGWQSTAKQDCDFSAVWTPTREDTALSYAGIILDEDMDPTDRAADRAERFSGYLESRRAEAGAYADRYDNGGSVHASQDKSRAVRSADRADRLAGHAVDAWRRAEYWQRRTAGVISHALYHAEPRVRMGRIKQLEADQRKAVAALEAQDAKRDGWQQVLLLADPNQARRLALHLSDLPCGGYDYRHPRPDADGVTERWRTHGTSLYSLLTAERCAITPQEAAALWLERNGDRDTSAVERWRDHYELRLAYERQMLEADGGRAGTLEIEPGGWIDGGQVHQVNRSSVTGRVVTAAVRVRRVTGWVYRVRDVPGCDYALMTVDVERMAPERYREPTDEERAAFAELIKAEKAAKKAAKPKVPPLVNPTNEDAERLQAVK